MRWETPTCSSSATVAAIAATVAELEQAGVAHLIVEVPGSSEAELLENLDWFGREVLADIQHA